MSCLYRRAFSTLGCPALSLDETLALASRHGLDAVEIRTLEGTTDLPALFARHGEDAMRLAQARHRDVGIVALSTSLRLDGGSEADRAALLAFVPWAEALGVRWLRAFDGGTVEDAGTVGRAAATLRWWQQLRREHGWKADIMVETHDGIVTPAAIRRLCAEVPDVAILWDAHNTWRKTGIDPCAVWPGVAANVVHIHVKDSIDRHSASLPYTFVLPGTGKFPMAALRDVLRRDGYDRAVSLEWERQWHPELPPLEDALRSAEERGWW